MLENPAADDGPEFCVVQVFPTLLISGVDPPMSFGVWYEMQIDRHDHLHLRIHALAPPEVAEQEGVADGLLEYLAGIHREDIGACEGRSGGHPEPELEARPARNAGGDAAPVPRAAGGRTGRRGTLGRVASSLRGEVLLGGSFAVKRYDVGHLR